MSCINLKCYLLVFLILSCQPDKTVNLSEEELTGITVEIKTKLINLGFNPQDAYKIEGGYMVEGDLFLSEADLNALPNFKIPFLEQYRTTNLVNATETRTITFQLILGGAFSS